MVCIYALTLSAGSTYSQQGGCRYREQVPRCKNPAGQLSEFWTSGTCFAYLQSVGPTCLPHVDLVSSRSHLFRSSSILKHSLITNKLKSVPDIYNCSRSSQNTFLNLFHELNIRNMISYKTYPNTSYLKNNLKNLHVFLVLSIKSAIFL